MKHVRLHARTRRPLLSTRFAMRFLAVCALLVATGVVYIWEQHHSLALGYEITQLRGSLAELDAARQKLEADVLKLRSPKSIVALIKDRGLRLQAAAPGQLVEVITPPPLPEPLEEEYPADPSDAEGMRLVRQ